jgi:hypothetical protein
MAKLCPSEPGLSTAEMRLRPDVRARVDRCSHPPSSGAMLPIIAALINAEIAPDRLVVVDATRAVVRGSPPDRPRCHAHDHERHVQAAARPRRAAGATTRGPRAPACRDVRGRGDLKASFEALVRALVGFLPEARRGAEGADLTTRALAGPSVIGGTTRRGPTRRPSATIVGSAHTTIATATNTTPRGIFPPSRAQPLRQDRKAWLLGSRR